MNEVLKYVFENNNLITDVIFNRSGEIKVKRQGDDFYLYFKDLNELVEYVDLKSMSFERFSKEVSEELKKYPFLDWKNKKTSKLVKKLFKDGFTVKEAVNFVKI